MVNLDPNFYLAEINLCFKNIAAMCMNLNLKKSEKGGKWWTLEGYMKMLFDCCIRSWIPGISQNSRNKINLLQNLLRIHRGYCHYDDLSLIGRNYTIKHKNKQQIMLKISHFTAFWMLRKYYNQLHTFFMISCDITKRKPMKFLMWTYYLQFFSNILWMGCRWIL